MAGKPPKARQNERGIWLYNAGIRQGYSDFFSFSDDYKIFTLQDSKCILHCVPVWLSGRALRQQRKRLWVRFPGNTHTNENV